MSERELKSHPAGLTVAEALAAVRPAVRVTAEGTVRALPRIKPGSAAAGKGKAVPEVTEDAAGKARPKDAPAIGAYEPVKE